MYNNLQFLVIMQVMPRFQLRRMELNKSETLTPERLIFIHWITID